MERGAWCTPARVGQSKPQVALMCLPIQYCPHANTRPPKFLSSTCRAGRPRTSDCTRWYWLPPFCAARRLGASCSVALPAGCGGSRRLPEPCRALLCRFFIGRVDDVLATEFLKQPLKVRCVQRRRPSARLASTHPASLRLRTSFRAAAGQEAARDGQRARGAAAPARPVEGRLRGRVGGDPGSAVPDRGLRADHAAAGRGDGELGPPLTPLEPPPLG